MKEVEEKELKDFLHKYDNAEEYSYMGECFFYHKDIVIAKIEILSIGVCKYFISELPK